MHTILIIDNDVKFCNTLSEYIAKYPEFDLLGNAFDGEMAMQMIDDLHPDLILIDPALKKRDGLCMIRHLRKNKLNYNPQIYVISYIGSPTLLEMLGQLEIDCFSLKPVENESLLQNIRQIFLRMDSKTPEITGSKMMRDRREGLVRKVMSELGLPLHLVSAKQTIDAVTLCLEDERNLFLKSSSMYMQLGSKYNANPLSIERNIRTSIKKMTEAKTDLYRQLFDNKYVPVSIFLGTVQDYIKKQWQSGRLVHQETEAQAW